MKPAADPPPNDPEPKSDAEPGAKPAAKDELKTLPITEVEKKLGSSPDGLTQSEAQKRLSQYGPNEIEEKKTNPLLKFLSYFWGPIPWMIEAAVILSGVVRHWPDFFIILLLLLANGAIGFWEEHQAGNAIAALRAKLAIKARVRRDGKWINPAAREVVPGDAIRLRLGDIVPTQKFKACIDACNTCVVACNHCAAACLREPNVQMMARCIALDMDCSQICALAVAAMARGSDHAKTICGVFADICQACGDECAKHDVPLPGMR